MENLLKISGKLFSLLLGDDMVPLETVKNIVVGSPEIVEKVVQSLTLRMGINLIFISINLAIVTYEYLFASWFMYLLTTFSGLKKLFTFIFRNPLLAVFFLCAFYVRMIGDSDREKFDSIVTFFGLPSYGDVGGVVFVDSMVRNVSRILGETLLGSADARIISLLISDSVRMKIGSVVSAKLVETMPIIVASLYTLGHNRLIKGVKPVSIEYMPSKEDTREFVEYIKEKGVHVKKEAEKYKKSVKDRVKTKSGCYCEGECENTVMGRKSWCYVDEKKCKRGKILPKFLGKTWDYCDPENVRKTYFNGKKYIVGTPRPSPKGSPRPSPKGSPRPSPRSSPNIRKSGRKRRNRILRNLARLE